VKKLAEVGHKGNKKAKKVVVDKLSIKEKEQTSLLGSRRTRGRRQKVTFSKIQV